MDNIILNTALIRHLSNRNAANLGQLDWIFQDLAARVMSRLDYIKLNPARIVDCGSGRGLDRDLLVKKFPDSQLIELDLALETLKLRQAPTQGMLSKLFKKSIAPTLLCADANYLPLATASIDFAYANLLLPYISDIPAFIRELRRVLNIGGAFCVSGLGVDSFKELRALGLSSYRFPDMHDIGDMCIDAGFSNPVVDTEYITLDYEDLAMLLREVKLVAHGAANAPSLRQRLTKSEALKLRQLYNLPHKLTLEIFVAHGWKDQSRIDLPAGQSVINFKR